MACQCCGWNGPTLTLHWSPGTAPQAEPASGSAQEEGQSATTQQSTGSARNGASAGKGRDGTRDGETSQTVAPSAGTSGQGTPPFKGGENTTAPSSGTSGQGTPPFKGGENTTPPPSGTSGQGTPPFKDGENTTPPLVSSGGVATGQGQAKAFDAPQAPYVSVRFERIEVRMAESGLEPGETAEWSMWLSAGGLSGTRWWSNKVIDGGKYVIDRAVSVGCSSHSKILLSANGVEVDALTTNDQLPPAWAAHDSTDNWGVGAEHQMSARSDCFDYTVFYTIAWQQSVMSAMPRSEAVSLARARALTAGVVRSRTDDQLFDLFVNQMIARGFQLRQLSATDVAFEGPGPVEREARQLFAAPEMVGTP